MCQVYFLTKFRDTEVEQRGVAVIGHQDVRRLDVAVNDEVTMGVL